MCSLYGYIPMFRDEMKIARALWCYLLINNDLDYVLPELGKYSWEILICVIIIMISLAKHHLITLEFYWM